MPPDDCACLRDLEKSDLIDQYAEHLSVEISEVLAGTCPVMIDFFVERLLARIIHMQEHVHDNALFDMSPKLLSAVENRLFRLSRSVPAVLNTIFNESRAREGDIDARH